MRETVIHTERLTKRFGNFTAVDHISFDVGRGEIFGFLGANGAGKTTAMRMLCGLSRPTEGSGSVAGYDIATQPEMVKRNIGYMSQRFSLYEDLKVWENLRLFGGIYGLGARQTATKTDEMLCRLGLEGERDTLVKALPLGWKQKLAFSVAIFHKPRVVFLDEPTGGRRPGRPTPFLGTDIQRRRQRDNHIRDHPLHGRGRILRPREHNGGRTDRGPRQARRPETAIRGTHHGRGVPPTGPQGHTAV